ncbi:hypothetical protein KAS06_01940, partial [Candidatus Bathyarchaeota archaeon]|nr:hypothetical protein [Candidatus Bathyarchaeota archaeon]
MVALKHAQLVCPYEKCGRPFQQAVMVTDSSKLPRETHYACPHCMLKVELLLHNNGGDKLGGVSIHSVEDEALLSTLADGHRSSGLEEAVSNPHTTRPTKGCKHFLGYLRTHHNCADIPDECAICPNIVQ